MKREREEESENRKETELISEAEQRKSRGNERRNKEGELMGIKEMEKEEEIEKEEIAGANIRDEEKNIGEERLDKGKGKGKRFIEI